MQLSLSLSLCEREQSDDQHLRGIKYMYVLMCNVCSVDRVVALSLRSQYVANATEYVSSMHNIENDTFTFRVTLKNTNL